MTSIIKLYAPAIALAVFAILAATGAGGGSTAALAVLAFTVFLHVRAEGHRRDG